MTRSFFSLLCILLSFAPTSFGLYRAGTVIDTYATMYFDNPGVNVPAADMNQLLCQSVALVDANDSNIIGGTRKLIACGRQVSDQNPLGNAKVQVRNTASASADANVYGHWRYIYDGNAAMPANEVSDRAVGTFTADSVYGNYDLPGLLNCGDADRGIYMYISTQDACHNSTIFMRDAGNRLCMLEKESPRFLFETLCLSLKEVWLKYDLVDFTCIENCSPTGGPYECDFTQLENVEVLVDAERQLIDALDLTVDFSVFGCCSTDGDCDDGDFCTTDTCFENECVNAPVVCDDNNECTDDSCNVLDGSCDYVPFDIEVRCDDSNDCTDQTCTPVGGCANPAGSSCDDSQDCTHDACNPQGGCENIPFTFVDWDDNNACTADSCIEPGGVDNTPIVCDDSDECTSDDCDPLTGCTITPINCDDGQFCTNDSCNPLTGCVNTPVVDATFCDDSNVCTDDFCNEVTDQCDNIDNSANCDDSNMCTDDICNPVTGCANPDFPPCDDSSECTQDSCDPATGCVHDAVGCDDSNVCTTDTCDPAAPGGCVNSDISGNCDTPDVCDEHICDPVGGCQLFSTVTCDDSDGCTADRCDPVNSCEYDRGGFCFPDCSFVANSAGPYYAGDLETPFDATITFTHGDQSGLLTATYTIDTTPVDAETYVFTQNPVVLLDTPGQPTDATFDIVFDCYNETLVTITICTTDNIDQVNPSYLGGPETHCCNVNILCEFSPLCPEVCEEEAKAAICYPDEDDNLNLICAHMADLPDYYSNGGFDPSLTDEYDCNCNPITPSPTAEPTMEPTPEPTPEPTFDPTSQPTGEPTAQPTDEPFTPPTPPPSAPPTPPVTPEPTPIPSPAPCMYEVPDLPGYHFQCIMDSNYNVDLAVVNLTDFDLGSVIDNVGPGAIAAWDLGTAIGMLDPTSPNEIWYDCWCHPQCPTDHYHIPELMLEHSWFDDGTLRMAIAMPKKFDESVSFYFQDSHIVGQQLTNGQCPDAFLLDPEDASCEFWTNPDATNSTEEFFRHNCYDAYIVEIPLELLTPELDDEGQPPHVEGGQYSEDGWEVTYCGVLVSESIQDLGLDVRGIDRDYWFRGNYRFCITFPLQVEVHLEDIRVYDEVNKIDDLIGAAVYETGFGWGFSYGGHHQYWGEVQVLTSVQWPFKLHVQTYKARTRDFATVPGGDLSMRTMPQGIRDDCADPLIGAYGDAAWVADATLNQADTGNYVPYPCIQHFQFEVLPESNTTCDFDDYIDIEFGVECQDSYADNCPLDERYYDNPLMCTFWLTTENICDVYEETIEVTAEMDSYSCMERTCECLENNFIQDFTNQDDEYEPETVYFQATVDSTERLAATQISSVETDLICEGMPDLMREIYSYFHSGTWAAQVNFQHDNYPVDPSGTCQQSIMENSVEFSMNLPQDVFDIPFDTSCRLDLWVWIDLFYCGVTRPDGLTPDGPTNCLNLLEDKEQDIELLSENQEVADTDVSFGISRSLRANLFINIGRPSVGGEAAVNNNEPVDDDAQINDDVAGEVQRDIPKASAFRAVPIFAVILSLVAALL